MNERIDNQIKQRVIQIVNQEWDQWAAEHKHLAQFIDSCQLLEPVYIEVIRDKEIYTALRKAYTESAKFEVPFDTLLKIGEYVKRILL